MYTTYPATAKQLNFLTTLLAERPTWADSNALDPITVSNLSKREASDWIDAALKQPKENAKPKGQFADLPDVPAGHYAVASRTGNNDLDFFRVDRPTEGRWAGYTFVKRVVGGQPEFPVRGKEQRQALEAIHAAGPAQAAALYGQEIGRCGRCNRTLTDELSRELGIGPICRDMAW